MSSNEEINNNTHNIKKTFKDYSNGVQVLMGQFDFSFLFSQNSPHENQKLGEILMSPEHAKVFSNILVNNINQYESMFGEIPAVDPEKMQKLHQEGKIKVEGNENE